MVFLVGDTMPTTMRTSCVCVCGDAYEVTGLATNRCVAACALPQAMAEWRRVCFILWETRAYYNNSGNSRSQPHLSNLWAVEVVLISCARDHAARMVTGQGLQVVAQRAFLDLVIILISYA